MTACPPDGFKNPMQPQKPQSQPQPEAPNKAEIAAAARAARKVAAEAEALRANLHRRKAQARASSTQPTPAEKGGPDSCR